MIIFSADPGSVNFAYCIQKICVVNSEIKIKFLGTGMLKSPVNEIKGEEGARQLRQFAKVLRRVRKKYEPEGVAMERFQSRGNGGNTIEKINMMLGQVPVIFHNAPVEFPTASTWKNRTLKHFDLKSAYRGYGLTSKAKSYDGPTEHQLDAALIGTWYGHKLLEREDLFDIFNRIDLDLYVESLRNAPRLSY